MSTARGFTSYALVTNENGPIQFESGSIDKLSVVIAIALAVVFLHERLTWHQWVGGSFIFTGALVLAYP